MTILVTGATGLVGPRLLTRLVDAGLDCRALVRPGRDVPAGVERVEGDILDPSTLAAAVEGVDAVLHLAALFRTADEAQIWAVNLDGTRNLLAAVAEHAPAARFLFASTSNVYGDGGVRPGRETDAVAPAAAYPASKVQAEALVRDSGLTWAILRLPFIYGDGDGHLEALPALAQQFGWHPAQRMSVAHHADIATAFRLGLTGALDGEIVNIADEAAMSITDMAALVGETYPGSDEPLPNPWKGVTDISKAFALGFEPTVPTIHTAVRRGLL